MFETITTDGVFSTRTLQENANAKLSKHKQDQTSNRYDSILQWLRTENGLMITYRLTDRDAIYSI